MRLGGQSELGSVAWSDSQNSGWWRRAKAVWWDLRLASLLTHLSVDLGLLFVCSYHFVPVFCFCCVRFSVFSVLFCVKWDIKT